MSKRLSLFLVILTVLMVFTVPATTPCHIQYSHHSQKDDLQNLSTLLEKSKYLIPAVYGIQGLDGTEYTISNGKILQTNDNQFSSLQGKTLEVYLLLLEKGTELGVREVQRELEYSSPNLAYYHLNKLHGMGIVEKTVQNKYQIVESKVGFHEIPESQANNLYLKQSYQIFTFFGILILLSILFILTDIPVGFWKAAYSIISILGLVYFYLAKNNPKGI